MKNLPDLFAELITSTGESLQRNGLHKTPKRAAQAFQSLTSGYQTDLQTVINDAIFDCPNKEMVVLKNIEFFSLCEHHLLPMIGKCHVAYLPRGKVLGLSKVARIIDVFARRLQIQETLTLQIAEALFKAVNPEGVIVITDAIHLCMMARGVSKQHAAVRSMATLGSFQNDMEAKKHFMQLVNFEDNA
jgi:GTP cyclohydrolase I